MSDSDSFIDEVTEEVRRDRLFAIFRRYGWIAALVIVAVVGGAAWNEYQKAQTRAQAEAIGDELLAAMRENDAAARAARLQAIDPATPGEAAIVAMSLAGAQAEAGDSAEAAEALNAIAVNGDLPEIYRQIAAFKALTLQSASMTFEERRSAFQNLATAGSPLRTLAEEQLALVDADAGETEAAIDRFQALLQDAEASGDLQQRAMQAIVALGGTPQPRTGSQG
jgi:hypothetical protein